MKRSRIDSFIMQQEGLESLSRDIIRAIQLKKLNRLLSLEKERNGYYRDLPACLKSLDELATLPFTMDETLAHQAGQLLLLSQSRIRRVLSDATSGTTGAAKRVFYTEADLENTVRLYRAGLGELVFPGDRVMICFPFSGPQGLGELIAEAVSRLGAAPLKLGCGLSYGEYADVMEREKPDCFVGMPVQLLSLLRVCSRGSLRRALVSGDACPDAVIHCCEDLLGSRLFPHYGSREMGMAGAITCPAHAGMHLRENDIIAEIVDGYGRVLPEGEFGELVITTIGMEALPLIRYRTGDYTRVLPGVCPCGSEVLRLDSVTRLGQEQEMARLDGAVFTLEEVVDCRVKLDGAACAVEALVRDTLSAARLTAAVKSVFPEREVSVSIRSVLPEDHALYPGKRVCLSS